MSKKAKNHTTIALLQECGSLGLDYDNWLGYEILCALKEIHDLKSTNPQRWWAPFYLQQGWGMISLGLEFVEQFPGTSVILSPRCYTPRQVQRYAREIPGQEGECCLTLSSITPALLTSGSWHTHIGRRMRRVSLRRILPRIALKT
ncbi:MAG: hypothetical protein VB144_12005 [Clostridia bacterium]|nr:hypothetical protein [Clostridia bacterium]